MRRTVIVALFVAAWLIGPVAYIHDGTPPPIGQTVPDQP